MSEHTMTTTQQGRFLCRRDVPSYVNTKFGLTLPKQTLDSLAKTGGGPPYHRWMGKAAYEVGPLDAWVAEQLGPARHRASGSIADELHTTH